jgi:hypothetical protein
MIAIVERGTGHGAVQLPKLNLWRKIGPVRMLRKEDSASGDDDDHGLLAHASVR